MIHIDDIYKIKGFTDKSKLNKPIFYFTETDMYFNGRSQCNIFDNPDQSGTAVIASKDIGSKCKFETCLTECSFEKIKNTFFNQIREFDTTFTTFLILKHFDPKTNKGYASHNGKNIYFDFQSLKYAYIPPVLSYLEQMRTENSNLYNMFSKLKKCFTTKDLNCIKRHSRQDYESQKTISKLIKDGTLFSIVSKCINDSEGKNFMNSSFSKSQFDKKVIRLSTILNDKVYSCNMTKRGYEISEY